MRDYGIPKLLSWRWAPCAALVLGSLAFVAFVSLTIPERIGDGVEGASSSTLKLGNHLARTQIGTGSSEPKGDWSSDDAQGDTPSQPAASQPNRMATLGSDSFPKRGFSPPLDRPEPPPPPPPPPPPAMTIVPPPQQTEAAPPPPTQAPLPPPQQLETQPEAAPPAAAPAAE